MSSLFLNGKRKRSMRKCQISLAIHPTEGACTSVVLTHEEGNFTLFLFFYARRAPLWRLQIAVTHLQRAYQAFELIYLWVWSER